MVEEQPLDDPVAGVDAELESPSERLRRLLAVPIAFLASSLGVVCVVSVPEVLPVVNDLALVDDRFIGWAGVGAALGLVLATLSLFVVSSLGSGPALSLGAAGAVFGLALSHDVVDATQLSLALVVLGASVGCLIGGAASMTFEVSAPYRQAVMVAWAVPLLGSWPLLAWLAQHVVLTPADSAARLTQHPSVWLLAPVAAAILVWGALTMLTEPVRAMVRSDGDWESAWSGLLATTMGGILAIMVLGFDPQLQSGWLRPLILLTSAGVTAGLAAVAVIVPDPNVRVAYVCMAFVALCLPVTVQLLVIVADDRPSRVSWGLAALLALTTVLGAAVGARRPARAPLALLVVAAGCAGAWVMPSAPWAMAAAAVPLTLGAGATFGAGARRAAATAVGWRFAAVAVVAIVLLSTVAAGALSWSLAGDLPTDTASARAAGRVLLGLTFALAVLAAGVVAAFAPQRRT